MKCIGKLVYASVWYRRTPYPDTMKVSGARAEGPRCNTEILINRRLLSDAFTEETLKGG